MAGGVWLAVLVGGLCAMPVRAEVVREPREGTVWLFPGGAGAVRDGDDTPRFQAAQDGVRARGGGTVRVAPGVYALSGNAYSTDDVVWVFEHGARLTGAGQLDAVVDRTTLNASGQAVARLMSTPGNEHGLFVSARMAPTTGTAPYEKAGVIVSVIQHDGSSYAGRGVLRDAVAVEAQGQIVGTPAGRIWGINTGVGPAAGADGYAVGGEFGVQSFSGSAAGTLGTPTSKIGVHVVAYGSSSATAGVVLSGNGTVFQDGMVAQQQAIEPGGHAFSVRPEGTGRGSDVAFIGRDGAAQFSALSVPAGGQVTIGSAIAATAGVTLDRAGLARLFWDEGQGRLVFAYGGRRLWSVDTGGTMRAAGAIEGSTRP